MILTDNELLIRALAFAADKPRMQRRKGEDASPYINHPIALMFVLSVEAGHDGAEVLAAAALHDTIEDTETTGVELENEFGSALQGSLLRRRTISHPISTYANNCKSNTHRI